MTAKAKTKIKYRPKDIATGYLFLSPVIIGMLVFTLVPIFFSLYVSFTEYNNITKPVWLGFANYKEMFRLPLFTSSIRFTFLYALVSVPLGMATSFLLAYILHKSFRGRNIYRAVFYIPVILPTVASTIIFKDMFASIGIINEFLYKLGLPAYAFFDKPNTAFVSILLFSLWGAGGSMLLWLASLNAVPKTYYEAAEISGAGEFTKLFRITLPIASPMIFYNLVMAIIGALQAFNQIYMLTNGGPVGSTTTIVLNIYNYGIKYHEMGIASAMAWFLFVIIGLLTMIVFKTNKWVYYEDGGRT